MQMEMCHFPCSIRTRTHGLILLLSLLLFLSSPSTRINHSAEASRAVDVLLGVDKGGSGSGEEVEVEAEAEAMMIGSRPPRCEGMCTAACGHCEAAQVPLLPTEKEKEMRDDQYSSTLTSRADDTSNYKPMDWKCKCGDNILNP